MVKATQSPNPLPLGYWLTKNNTENTFAKFPDVSKINLHKDRGKYLLFVLFLEHQKCLHLRKIHIEMEIQLIIAIVCSILFCFAIDLISNALHLKEIILK